MLAFDISQDQRGFAGAITINRACVFSNRPYTSQVEKQKLLRLDLCALKLAQKIHGCFFPLFTTSDMWLIIPPKIAKYLQT